MKIAGKVILQSARQAGVTASRLTSDLNNHRRLLGMVSLAFASVLWLVVAPSVYAADPVTASGTSVNTLTPISIRTADGNTFIDYTYVEMWHGALDGTRVGSGALVIHPDGTVNAHASGVFTGSIAGRSGIALLRISVSGTVASAVGHFTVTDGTGELAGAHVEGTDHAYPLGPATFGATYTADIQFTAP